MSEIDQFYGPNAGYIAELYDRYRENPDSVDAATRALFANWNAPAEPSPAVSAPSSHANAAPSPANVMNIVYAARTVRLARKLGHRDAAVNPLVGKTSDRPKSKMEQYGLTPADLAALPASVVGGPLAEGAANALEALERVQKVYSGPAGYENDHVQEPAELKWLQEAVESQRYFTGFDAEFQTRPADADYKSRFV